MQDIPMSRWLSPLMAFCLSFVIMATLAPTMGIQIDRQLDFWLLWFGTMLLWHYHLLFGNCFSKTI